MESMRSKPCNPGSKIVLQARLRGDRLRISIVVPAGAPHGLTTDAVPPSTIISLASS